MRPLAERPLWRWGPCLAYMALIFALSAESHPPDVGPDTPAHFFEYAVLGVLLARALAKGLGRVSGKVAAASFGLSTLYGVSDELHQRFVPGRECSFKDLVMDALGSGTAVLLLWAAARLRPARAAGIGD